jgi:hypothetical protein
MKKQKYQFESTFANIKIRPVVSEEKDKYLSVASLDKLKKFLPEINTDDNIDLLPVAFDACVVNRVNKNGDVIDGETAAKIAKNFVNKPINIEHDRKQVIGCIVSASFSKFGSNESLAEMDVKSMKTPFNITLGGVIWKVVDRDLADQIEESNDPTSDNYMSISASWELGFNDFNIIVLDNNEKNIENATIISDAQEIDKLKNNLRGFGGNGKMKNEKSIYRQVLGKVVPLGVGFTLNPAADVQGIATPEEKPAVLELKDNKSSEDTQVPIPGDPNFIGPVTPEDIEKFKKEEKSEANIIESSEASENNTSHEEELNVKKERIYMKITKIEDITDALLKEVTASSVSDFIAEELKKASDQFTAEKAEKDNELKAANEKISTVTAEQEAVKKQVEELTQKLASLESEKEAKAKEEKFNMHMASFDEEFELSDEDRKVLASDLKDLTEEGFSAYKSKMSVLMKEKNKAAKKAAKEKMSKKDIKQDLEEDVKDKGVDENKEDKTGKMVKASVESASEISTTQDVVEQAVDNGSKASTTIPNSAPAAQPSVKEKYASAFGFDGFELTNK